MQRMESIWSRTFMFILFSNLILFLAFEMLLPTLPLYVVEIGGSESQIGLVTSVFMFSAITVRLFPGFLASLMNKKYLLLIGIAVCGIATILYGYSESIYLLLLVRMLHGLGFGIATTLFAAFVANTVPAQRLGEGMGYFAVGETLAISLGPLVGVWLIGQFGFSPLFTTGGLILLLSFLMTCFVKKLPNQPEEKADFSIQLFEKRVLFPSFLVLLTGLAAGSIMSYAAVFAKSMSFDNSAWFFFTVAVSSLIVRLFSGKIYDLKGPAPLIFIGSVFSIGGFIILAICSTEIQFILAAVLYGIGFGVIFPALQAWCSQLVGIHEQESAMASFFNFFDLGIGGGSLLLGWIVSAFSYQAIYLFAACMYAAVFVVYFLFGLKKPLELAK